MYSDMDMIVVAVALLAVFGVVLAIAVYYARKAAIEGKRPHSGLFDTSSKIMDALDNLAGEIGDQNPELDYLEGDLVTAAAFPLIWETILKQFQDGEMVRTTEPRLNWRTAKQYEHLREMRFSASKSDKVKIPGMDNGRGSTRDYSLTVYLTLKFYPLESGGTRVRFQYRFEGHHTNDFGYNMVRFTNHALRYVCMNLTIDPERAQF